VAEEMGVKFFLPTETTTAESPDRASNLEPYNYQADALAVCYCLPAMFTICCRFHCSFLQKPVELAYIKYSYSYNA